MFEQDLESHQHQDQAAGQLRPGFIAAAEDISNLYAHDGEGEGDHADKGYGRQNGDGEKGEGDANGQSVDAGGHGQKRHAAHVQGRVRALRLRFQGFLDHVAADQRQQDEGDPVIVGRDGVTEPGAQQVADEGHGSLESAEVQSHHAGALPAHPGHGKAFTDGHGEGVHGQSHGDDKQLC